MQVFDASSMIHAWDNYPIRQLPGLWEWMAEQISDKRLVMPRVAFDEVKHKTPECAKWLKDNEIELLQVSNEIINEALRIKNLAGIVDDHYHSKGVDENDLFIIATARVHKGELVSDEGRQANPPQDSTKRKIPAVCAMSEVAVPCINFIEFFKRSEKIIR
jgi:hypothetical protein